MSNVLRAKLKKLARNDKKADKNKSKEKRGVAKSAPTVSPEPCANVSCSKNIGTHTLTHTDTDSPYGVV